MASLAASAPAVTMDSPANVADPADLAATGTDSTFDDSEREGIAALRIRLRQFCASHADSAAHLCAEDATLWRYLVAREWVVEDAATMFEAQAVDISGVDVTGGAGAGAGATAEGTSS